MCIFASMKLKTTKEYAELCEVSETVIRKRIKKGELIPVEKGGYYFIDADRFPPRGAGVAGRPNANEILSRVKI